MALRCFTRPHHPFMQDMYDIANICKFVFEIKVGNIPRVYLMGSWIKHMGSLCLPWLPAGLWVLVELRIFSRVKKPWARASYVYELVIQGKLLENKRGYGPACSRNIDYLYIIAIGLKLGMSPCPRYQRIHHTRRARPVKQSWLLVCSCIYCKNKHIHHTSKLAQFLRPACLFKGSLPVSMAVDTNPRPLLCVPAFVLLHAKLYQKLEDTFGFAWEQGIIANIWWKINEHDKIDKNGYYPRIYWIIYILCINFPNCLWEQTIVSGTRGLQWCFFSRRWTLDVNRTWWIMGHGILPIPG